MPVERMGINQMSIIKNNVGQRRKDEFKVKVYTRV